MSHRVFGFLFAAVMALVPPGLAMASEQGTFDISLRGIKAGVLSYSGDAAGGQYAAAGAARAAGFASVVVEAQVDVRAEGQVSGTTYRPRSYTESGQRGEDRLQVCYTYRNGVPRIERDPPRSKPPRYPVSTAQQRGSLDPMTTAFAMLRDQPRDMACNLALNVYDGQRLANIRYAGSQPRGDGGLTCRGEYRRVAGFSEKDLAEKPVWPFTVIYAPAGDLLRVVEVTVPTTYGTLRMRRR